MFYMSCTVDSCVGMLTYIIVLILYVYMYNTIYTSFCACAYTLRQSEIISPAHMTCMQRLYAQTPLIRFVVDLLYNLLYNKSTTNPQQVEMSTTNPQQIESCTTFCSNSTYSICCGFVVQLVVQQIHNKSTTSPNVYNKSTTNRKLYNKSTTS